MKSAESEKAVRSNSTVLSNAISRRVVVLSLLLALFFGYILPIVDFKLSNTFLGATHLPPGAVAALLFIVVCLNPLLRLLSKKLVLRREESLTIYISCLFSSLVPGHGSENFLLPNLIAPFYYATPTNKWLAFLQAHLKSWFSPALRNGSYDAAGQEVVTNWYIGNNGAPIPWHAWLVPLLAWGAVVFASYIMLACLAALLRAQWADREALAYPLLRLPLALVEDKDEPDSPRLLKNKLAWLGIGIAMFVQLLNGLHLYFPDVPGFVMNLNLAPYFAEPPWNQIGEPPALHVWPIVIGIAFLLPREISLSLWAFYWFVKLEMIASWSLGYPSSTLPRATGMGAPAFIYYQKFGAYWMFSFLVLWTGREHWKHIARRAFGRERARAGEDREALSYPVAFWGFVLSFAFVVGWSACAGVRLDIAAYLWLSYLVIAIALSRMVAEAGLLFVQHGMRPLGAVSQMFGSGEGAFLTPSSMVPASFIQHSLMYDLRGFIMPSFVQSFKLAHDEKIPLRRLLVLIFAVTTISLIMGLWMRVRLGYESAGLTMNEWAARNGAKISASNVLEYLNGPKTSGPINPFWIVVGGGMTWLLFFARSRFAWFPIHPIGYLLTLTYALDMLWFSVALGWLCKTLVTRFGGIESYRKTTPFFLGLALGDVAMMIFWLLVDGWQGRTAHLLMPG